MEARAVMHTFMFHLGDYARDTQHLSWDEDMAYVRLMRLYYSSEQPLPADVAMVCRRVRATEAYQVAAVEAVLHEFFELGADGWHQKRCDQEIAFYKSRSDKAKHAAALRWQSERSADAMHGQSERYANHNHNHNHNHQEKRKALSGKPDVVSLKPEREIKVTTSDAIEVLQFLNEKTGKSFKPVPANLRLIAARLNEGNTVEDLRCVIANRIMHWSSDPKMSVYLRPKTLFDATNFASYRGEISDEG
jgi:uncharacterized phage protein (TIGR02220 family)